MASTQANAPAAVKLSFAKIAATGLKPPGAQQTQSDNFSNIQKRSITSAPRDGGNIVTPSVEVSQATSAVKPLQFSPQSQKEPSGQSSSGPEVRVYKADGMAQGSGSGGAEEGMLAPAASDEANTQLSSSSGSAKPQSLDGKSVASGTTYTLDEKESLRPDDSASVNAVEDEEIFTAPISVMAEPHISVESGARAFRDQLREISCLEPRNAGAPQPYGAPTHVAKGVLYVPPLGPGVGVIPTLVGSPDGILSSASFPPDPKLLEALESPRDRLMVMKLQTDIIDFITDAKEASLTLPQCNAYHRMLAHKAADYYLLGHVVDDASSGVRLFKTPNTCLRPPLIDTTTPSTAASTPPPSGPQMKILRRGMDNAPAIVNGSNVASKSGSDDEEDGKKKILTREEREARYEIARMRIMGAPKPSGSPDEPKTKESSRSSSATGKKSRKKHRPDSDDGFEARSAYSAYYAPPHGTQGASATTYSFAPSNGQVAQHAPLSRENSLGAYQPYPTQMQGNMQWPSQGYGSSVTQQSPYDLAQDFQRAMSFQNMAMPQQNMLNTGYGYPQQYYGAQQTWPQQQPYQMTPQPIPGNGNYYGDYQSQGPPANAHELQPYRYGQLPSQTYPGRSPSSLEHPLPGSYKGKHFNPQSQTFVPTHTSSSSSQAFTPTSNGSPYAVGSPLHSAHGQGSAISSPHHSYAAPMQSHAQAQPMLHPLPQPVFPRQPSPGLPLPPKPGSTPQQPTSQQHAPATTSNMQTPSSIAKWGTPASLPAKPPPPAQPFDAAKFPQLQRQTSYSTAATARVPSGGMPSFGSMPPMAGGTYRQ
ncbi:hypothetical protein LTR27_001268 [Elasticomyces elasticus]|nr:hypothetical protein LTR27_001268 [Elasticomyces elasticus]